MATAARSFSFRLAVAFGKAVCPKALRKRLSCGKMLVSVPVLLCFACSVALMLKSKLQRSLGRPPLDRFAAISFGNGVQTSSFVVERSPQPTSPSSTAKMAVGSPTSPFPDVNRLSDSPSTVGGEMWPWSRGKVVHLHIHNCAGTWMCRQASNCGESVVKDNNCNLAWIGERMVERDPDGPFTTVFSSNLTCAGRKDQMEKESASFIMIERWMEWSGGDWCPGVFNYTVILRDPMARVRTTMRVNHASNYSRVFGLLSNKWDLSKTPWIDSHACYNDLMVRILNGPEAMRRPLGALSQDHLHVAMERLEKFNVILRVPHLAEDSLQLNRVLGWNMSLVSLTRVRSSESPRYIVPKKLHMLLKQHNQLDLELYQYGLQLAAEKSKQAFAMS